MKVCLNSRERNWDLVLIYYGIVYNHVLKLDLQTLRWELVDNYGDIPGVRMGSRNYSFPLRSTGLIGLFLV